MRNPEDLLIETLKESGVDFVSSLPCEKVSALLLKASRVGVHVPLTREEEGAGISAGAALAGRRPAMIIQSSGFGNMVNALLSLNAFYGLPLALFVSHRGVYKEKIAAQVPMGAALPGLLGAAGIGYTYLRKPVDLSRVRRRLDGIYARGGMHAFLMSPSLWEACGEGAGAAPEGPPARRPRVRAAEGRRPAPRLARYGVIKAMAPAIKGNVVVANIGVPSKELFSVLDQPSNFYMLGSMGMATPVGLGLALSLRRKVFVIDGDGSLLMNPGTLATVALKAPRNLVVVAVDNGSYGSTGGQPTHAASVADLSAVARGFGIRDVLTVSGEREILEACRARAGGPRFIHVVARPGNAPVPNIPVGPEEIKGRFMEAAGRWRR